jgi:hypothetical protein
MYFIVQISPFVHLFTLKIVFRWGEEALPWTPHQGSALDLLGALGGPQILRRKLCLHFILYLATPLKMSRTSFYMLILLKLEDNLNLAQPEWLSYIFIKNGVDIICILS